MLLTEKTFHDIALQARAGMRECLQMIALHGGQRENAFLNPPIVLTAVSTWERFLVDVALASEKSNWSLEVTGWDRHYDSSVPWPGSNADRKERHSRQHEHAVDAVLARNGVLIDAPFCRCVSQPAPGCAVRTPTTTPPASTDRTLAHFHASTSGHAQEHKFPAALCCGELVRRLMEGDGPRSEPS